MEMSQKPTASPTLPKKPFGWEKLVITGLMVGGLIWSGIVTEVNVPQFVANFGQFAQIIVEMLKPDWSYVSYVVAPLIQTIKMAVIGTAIGAGLAFPYAFLVSRNVVTNRFVTGLFRFILNIIRTIYYSDDPGLAAGGSVCRRRRHRPGGRDHYLGYFLLRHGREAVF